MTLRLFAIALATVLLTTSPSPAQQSTSASPTQQTPPPYGPPISLEVAKKIMAAAEAEAAKNNWQVAITIIDSGGHMVMMQKFDNTQLASIAASEGKAQTSLAFKLPSKALEDAIAAGGAGTRLLALKNIAPFEGGFPILVDGKIIGAIGVSGALSAQDAQVARAGLSALGN
jgi:glc operon protein GlcG